MLQSLIATFGILAASTLGLAGTQAHAAGDAKSASESTIMSQPVTANRNGSKRVGGNNGKGKGSKYVGGRKR